MAERKKAGTARKTGGSAKKSGAARKKPGTTTATRMEQDRLRKAEEMGLRQGDESGEGKPGTDELVTPQEHARAAKAVDDQAVEAIVEQHEAAPDALQPAEKLEEEAAEKQAEPQAEVALRPARPGENPQDQPFFQAARRDEAVAQGVEKTTQERLWELARAEELAPQGLVEFPDDPLEVEAPREAESLTARLYREARAEEVRAEKREEAMFGSPDGVAAVASMNAKEGRTDMGEGVPEAEKVEGGVRA